MSKKGRRGKKGESLTFLNIYEKIESKEVRNDENYCSF